MVEIFVEFFFINRSIKGVQLLQYLNISPLLIQPPPRSMKRNAKYTSIVAASCVAFALSASAQSLITWNASVDMYADGVGNDGDQSFVSTNGTSVFAINASSVEVTTNVTVNGVAFTGTNDSTLEAGHTQGAITLTSTDVRSTDTAYQDGGFSGDLNIENLLQGGVFDAATFTFSGLTVGQKYEIQIFTNDARGGSAGGIPRTQNWQVGFSDGTQSFADSQTAGTEGNSHLTNRLVSDLTGELSGDSIVGTFIAGATGIQAFEFSGTRDAWANIAGGTAQINALQLRAVPEPSTFALLAGCFALAAIMLRRRR